MENFLRFMYCEYCDNKRTDAEDKRSQSCPTLQVPTTTATNNSHWPGKQLWSKLLGITPPGGYFQEPIIFILLLQTVKLRKKIRQFLMSNLIIGSFETESNVTE